MRTPISSPRCCSKQPWLRPSPLSFLDKPGLHVVCRAVLNEVSKCFPTMLWLKYMASFIVPFVFDRPMVDVARRAVLSEVSKRFPTMLFSVRSLNAPQARFGLVECLNHDMLQPYPVLHEKSGQLVSPPEVRHEICHAVASLSQEVLQCPS